MVEVFLILAPRSRKNYCFTVFTWSRLHKDKETLSHLNFKNPCSKSIIFNFTMFVHINQVIHLPRLTTMARIFWRVIRWMRWDNNKPFLHSYHRTTHRTCSNILGDIHDNCNDKNHIDYDRIYYIMTDRTYYDRYLYDDRNLYDRN